MLNKQNSSSICDMLFAREGGYLSAKQAKRMLKIGTVIADDVLVRSDLKKLKDIKKLTGQERSSYIIESTENGMAAASQTNRCISIINTHTMCKVKEINNINRTVWTIAFHPTKNIIVTGSLGGIISIFQDFELIRQSPALKEETVTSITFHPIDCVIVYTVKDEIVLFNYDTGYIYSIDDWNDSKRFKYVKFIPNTNILLTGIRYDKKLSNVFRNDQPADAFLSKSCTEFLLDFFRTISVILDSLEFVDDPVDAQVLWIDYINKIVPFNQTNLNSIRTQPYRIYDLPGPKETFHVNSLQDFQPTLKGFLQRINAINKLINAERYEKNIFVEYNFRIDIIEALLKISDGYLMETHDIRNRSKINRRLLEKVFLKMDCLMIINGESRRHIDRIRQFADFPHQYKLQAWPFNMNNLPDLKQDFRNTITFCQIHNDSAVDISRCGRKLVTFRRKLRFPPDRSVIEVHSLMAENFGELLFRHDNYNDALIMSLSWAPSLEYILVGLRSTQYFGYFLKYDKKTNRTSVPRVLTNDLNESINYLKWVACPGDGIIIGYQSFHLRYIRHF